MLEIFRVHALIDLPQDRHISIRAVEFSLNSNLAESSCILIENVEPKLIDHPHPRCFLRNKAYLLNNHIWYLEFPKDSLFQLIRQCINLLQRHKIIVVDCLHNMQAILQANIAGHRCLRMKYRFPHLAALLRSHPQLSYCKVILSSEKSPALLG